jgi:hypothetical protein
MAFMSIHTYSPDISVFASSGLTLSDLVREFVRSLVAHSEQPRLLLQAGLGVILV